MTELKMRLSLASGGTTNVDVLKRDEDAIVKIKDTGIGIKKESQEKLFNPCIQVDSTDTRKFEGTGFGLSVRG